MMDYEAQLRVQAYADGELPKAETEAAAQWLERDREAAALLAELRHTRQALSGFETEVKLPESREFYWSKLQRSIERLDQPQTAPAQVPWLARLRRFLVPASAVAALAIVGLVATRYELPTVPAAETAAADSGALTYRDSAAGATLVWLSYPADNNISDEESDPITD